MLDFGGMMEAAEVLRTTTGAALPMPTSDDTSNEGEIIAENAQHNQQDITFGSVTLNAHMYSSKIVLVSIQLLQDSAIDVDGHVGTKLAERLARIMNRHATTGTGSSQPEGVMTSAPAKVRFNGSNAVTQTELIDLEHALDPAYRRQGARWMFHDTTLRDIKKLTDNDGRLIWQAGLSSGEPDTLLRYPYTINQHMEQMASGARSIAFGNFKKYYIRIVRELTMLRLVERYADYLQVGFLAFNRMDGKLVDAGTNPIVAGIHVTG